MAIPIKDIYIAKKPAQRKALTSPLRLEILEHFLFGPMAVADLAKRMGRRPDSLYYHVRTLEKVGLLLPAGTRKSGKRDERLYRIVAEAIGLPSSSTNKEMIDSAIKTMAAAFRTTERDMRTALERGYINDDDEEQNFWAIRQRCRMRPAALTRINKHFESIQNIIEKEFRRTPKADDGAVTCSFTFAIIPLDDPTEN